MSTEDVEASIELLLRAGWRQFPQVHGPLENSLMLSPQPGFQFVVTLPDFGPSVVVAIEGGPCRGHRRSAGRELWRHQVPVGLAIQWALSNPADDAELAKWEENAQRVQAPARWTWPDDEAPST